MELNNNDDDDDDAVAAHGVEICDSAIQRNQGSGLD